MDYSLEICQVLAGDENGTSTICRLFLEYQAELGIDLCFQSFQEELDSLPGKYAPPKGRLYLVKWDGDVAGCGALRPLEDGVCEIKRIYIRPMFRKKGIARALSNRLIQDAIDEKYETCRLDTLARLTQAVALYKSLGFERTEPYNFNPEPDILYFERSLRKPL